MPLSPSVFVSMTAVATMILVMLARGVELAPAERGPGNALQVKARGPRAMHPTWGELLVGPLTSSPRRLQRATSPDRRAQMLRLISALEEMHRTLNSTLSTRITFLPRANGRNSGKKNKMLTVAESSAKPTTVPPMETGVTVSRDSTDVIVSSNLTGRNLKKSIQPQPKKTNKRVCFWKYCSQN